MADNGEKPGSNAEQGNMTEAAKEIARDEAHLRLLNEKLPIAGGWKMTLDKSRKTVFIVDNNTGQSHEQLLAIAEEMNAQLGLTSGDKEVPGANGFNVTTKPNDTKYYLATSDTRLFKRKAAAAIGGATDEELAAAVVAAAPLSVSVPTNAPTPELIEHAKTVAAGIKGFNIPAESIQYAGDKKTAMDRLLEDQNKASVNFTRNEKVSHNTVGLYLDNAPIYGGKTTFLDMSQNKTQNMALHFGNANRPVYMDGKDIVGKTITSDGNGTCVVCLSQEEMKHAVISRAGNSVSINIGLNKDITLPANAQIALRDAAGNITHQASVEKLYPHSELTEYRASGAGETLKQDGYKFKDAIRPGFERTVSFDANTVGMDMNRNNYHGDIYVDLQRSTASYANFQASKGDTLFVDAAHAGGKTLTVTGGGKFALRVTEQQLQGASVEMMGNIAALKLSTGQTVHIPNTSDIALVNNRGEMTHQASLHALFPQAAPVIYATEEVSPNNSVAAKSSRDPTAQNPGTYTRA